MDPEMEKTKELAERIIILSQKRIVEDCPPLLMAVYALQPCEKEEKEKISTDGKYFYYHPERVLWDFRKDKDAVAEQILHVLLHCLLGHLKERQFYRNQKLFDVLADGKVANFATEICKHLGQSWIWSVPHWLESDTKSLAQQYQKMTANKTSREFLIKKEAKALKMDDHDNWHKKDVLTAGTELSGEEAVEGDGLPAWGKIRTELFCKAKKTGCWGDLAGDLLFDGEMAAENEISYEAFLRRFTVNREQMKEDPDSIDFRWYHFGLETYGNIPLLEPTECNEMLACDHIVIAIDTSGSCEGEVCSRFLRETLHLLRDISAGREQIDVTVLQCDTEIQQEMKITSSDEIEEKMKGFQPRGFGGTDFRPVFRWVETYRKNGGRINAVLYLSDGEGDFPEQRPDYPVVFLLYDAWDAGHIPSWVTQLYLNTDDFTVKEGKGCICRE